MRDKRLSNDWEREGLVRLCANYMIEYDWSVRTIAEEVNISKSTVQRFFDIELRCLDSELYRKCRKIRDRHKRLGSRRLSR